MERKYGTLIEHEKALKFALEMVKLHVGFK